MRMSIRIIFIILIFAGAASAGPREIIYNLGVDPRTIDPFLNHALDGGQVDANIFEGLVRRGFNDKIEPACAESWDISPDGLTWTFYLRDNLKWSDGKKLTAQHFKDGFMHLIAPETAAPNANYGFFIKNAEKFYKGEAKAEEVGLSVPDGKTFIITLEYKNPLMLDYMSFQTFVPARMDVINNNPRGWAARPETIVSNGAFILSKWKHGSGGEIVLLKNNNYWDSENVKIDRLRFVLIGDSNTALAAFKAGKIDYISSIPARILPALLKTGEAKSLPALGTSFIDFNCAHKPFDDSRVRRAFTLAVDRSIITDKLLGSGEKPATGIVSYLVPGVNISQDFRTEGGAFLPVSADVEQARKLLAEAGYPNGENFPEVSLKYSGKPGSNMLAEVLQNMWKQVLGVNVGLLNEEWKVFLQSMQEGNFDMAASSWILDFPDASNILDTYKSDSPQNDMSWKNSEFDELMRKSALEMDHSKRINYMHEAEKILMREMPSLPLYFLSSPEMKSERVKNIYQSPLGIILFRTAEIVNE
ncbi:MAG: peptide ABC transporter substrate-binding protein [Synergistaceae bacterium]|nr:peptide ABC transporter substrate-binding protein [Synergistaceae bacterium]